MSSSSDSSSVLPYNVFFLLVLGLGGEGGGGRDFFMRGREVLLAEKEVTLVSCI